MVMYYYVLLRDLLIPLNNKDFDIGNHEEANPLSPNIYYDKLPTSDDEEKSSNQADDAYEMDASEDDIENDDATDYESDTSLFKLTKLELERRVKRVEEIQISNMIAKDDYEEDDDGKIRLYLNFSNSNIFVLERLLRGRSGPSNPGADFPSGAKKIYWEAHKIWTYLPFTVSNHLIFVKFNHL
jgi:hypothetical protein